MRRPNLLAVLAATGAALAAWSAPSLAATAHNSQAGSWGSTTNNCAATPYFPADEGCLGSAVQRWQADGAFPPPDDLRARYRPRPPLQ